MLTATIALMTAYVQTPAMAVYRDAKLGLQFEYPKTWKVRRDKFSAVFELPMASGQVASVQIFNAQYKGTVDDWQLIQVEINRSMKRVVERQWQEEILGVPMVLTKLSYDEAGRGKIGIIGLLYTAYADKMNFRLTSPAEVAEQAETDWRNAMLTLRTISGELPNVENPNLPSVKPEPEKTSTVWTPGGKPAKLERGSEIVEFETDSVKYKLNLPKDWVLDKGRLTGHTLQGTLEVTAAVGLPEEAGQKLVDSAKLALAEFESVALREDPKSEIAKSGAVVGKVFRTGKSKSGALVLGSVVGYCEGVYWLLSYRATDAKAYAKDRDALEDLFRLLYVEKS